MAIVDHPAATPAANDADGRDGMNALPTNIEIASARLPATYEQAKIALASCEHIDECKTWANKAEALASYAKMAHDDSLRQLANRIQARAVRRMGELLKQFDARGDHMKKGDAPLSRTDAATRAGISPDQRKQAVRVANVPAAEFEAAIENEKPATVTALAEMGKKVRAVPVDDEPGQAEDTFPVHFGSCHGGRVVTERTSTKTRAKADRAATPKTVTELRTRLREVSAERRLSANSIANYRTICG
jgi:hypothetical protein